MTSLVLDPEKSRARIRTFAEGLFSRLAHDLELECRELRATATATAEGLGSAAVEVPIGAIDVAGTLKGDRVDRDGVSREGREEILEKMRREVFHVTGRDSSIVRVEATLVDARRARVRVIPPHGTPLERAVDVTVGAGLRVSGRLELSISALGGGTVKGPMNAFRVKDAVVVLFDVVWRTDQPA